VIGNIDTDALGREPIPVIVISFNRGDLLRRVVASYRRQSVPVEIVVHDNGSDDPATLKMALMAFFVDKVPVR